MNIPLLSMAMSQANLQTQVDLSLMKQVMGTSETNANGLINMLERPTDQPVHPYLGQNLDIQV